VEILFILKYIYKMNNNQNEESKHLQTVRAKKRIRNLIEKKYLKKYEKSQLATIDKDDKVVCKWHIRELWSIPIGHIAPNRKATTHNRQNTVTVYEDDYCKLQANIPEQE